MKRPDQHDTDKAGQALLFTYFARIGWEVTPMGQGTDYGRDFTVEVFRNKKTTGIVFNVQLKSTVAPAHSADGGFMSIPLKVPNARYLAHELKTPSILMQADVTAGKLFWSAPQIDLALLASLATKRENQSCTVRVPTSHELPATQDQLLDTITNLLTVLAARAMQETSTREFVAATTSVADSQQLKSEEIPRLWRGGSSSLTFTGVHPRNSLREPTKAHAKENPDGPIGESKPLRMGVQIPRIIHPKMSTTGAV
jgi:hypothetical protein